MVIGPSKRRDYCSNDNYDNCRSNVGAPRFAAGTTDSMPVGGSGLGYYRVVLLR